MDFDDYAKWQPKFNPLWTAMAPDEGVLQWAILEMTGEAGEVLELLQKSVRKAKDIDRDKLKDELSDVLWGIIAICNVAGFDIHDIALHNWTKLELRNANKGVV